MAHRVAVAGLRHGHVLSAVRLAEETPGVEIVACAEDHEPTRDSLAGQVRITHTDTLAMIGEVDCDIVLIGDYFGRRGSLAIEALRRGRHVLSDKPIATSLDELGQIGDLAGRAGLAVGCQLDLAEHPNFVRLRELIRGGGLGEVHQIAFGGQHPLMFGTRAPWYFEPGKQGGTINDIAIHALHLIPWMTGLEIDRVVAARTWNAFAVAAPHFNDAAQLMLSLSNGAGVMGDVSYSMPGPIGYKLPQYWRFTLFGTEGMAETSCSAEDVTLVRKDGEAAEQLGGAEAAVAGYFQSFLHEVEGRADLASYTTADVMRASQWALELQRVADA